MVRPFFPKEDPELLLWAKNYKERLAINESALGLTPAEVTVHDALCDEIIDGISAVKAQKGVLKSTVEAKNLVVETQGAELRYLIGRIKKMAGYTEAIGKDLGVVGSTVPFDPTEFKPIISTSLDGGYVRIKFAKKGTQGINLYGKNKAGGDWKLVGRANKSPYDIQIVLENPNQPEHWQYRAYGVINDLEVGLPSDIAEIIFGL